MAHEAAMTQAWDAVAGVDIGDGHVAFLGDEYVADITTRQVLHAGDASPAGEHLSLLILHYLARRAEGLPPTTGEWLSLTELSLGGRFSEVYVERAVGPLREAFGADPGRLFEALATAPGERVERADAAIVVEVLPGVPVLVDVWGADEEFPPEAGLLFDRGITSVFVTEDILELAETTAEALVERCRPSR